MQSTKTLEITVHSSTPSSTPDVDTANMMVRQMEKAFAKEAEDSDDIAQESTSAPEASLLLETSSRSWTPTSPDMDLTRMTARQKEKLPARNAETFNDTAQESTTTLGTYLLTSEPMGAPITLPNASSSKLTSSARPETTISGADASDASGSALTLDLLKDVSPQTQLPSSVEEHQEGEDVRSSQNVEAAADKPFGPMTRKEAKEHDKQCRIRKHEERKILHEEEKILREEKKAQGMAAHFAAREEVQRMKAQRQQQKLQAGLERMRQNMAAQAEINVTRKAEKAEAHRLRVIERRRIALEREKAEELLRLDPELTHTAQPQHLEAPEEAQLESEATGDTSTSDISSDAPSVYARALEGHQLLTEEAATCEQEPEELRQYDNEEHPPTVQAQHAEAFGQAELTSAITSDAPNPTSESLQDASSTEFNVEPAYDISKDPMITDDAGLQWLPRPLTERQAVTKEKIRLEGIEGCRLNNEAQERVSKKTRGQEVIEQALCASVTAVDTPGSSTGTSA